MKNGFLKLARIENAEAFRAHLDELELDLPVDDEILSAAQSSPLARPMQVGRYRVGNRWCIHPMEGWDANRDGSPSDYTLRRWRNFGLSGAKLIWGGEAAAVCANGRANPNQTLAVPENKAGLAQLLTTLVSAHQESFGQTDDLVVGLQLTHSGRFSHPEQKNKAEPCIAYHHPLLDQKFHIDPNTDHHVISDDDVRRLIDRYIVAARVARDVGYQFVDVKACHGYLVHEFLSAHVRPGPYGGGFDGRTQLLREIIGRIRDEIPDLTVVVRLSVFDVVPYQTSRQTGQPMEYRRELPYRYGFGVDPSDPLSMDLTEAIELIRILRDMQVAAISVSCGSPYYCPHVQRPAAFPPSDGYLPPEDPLVAVARQIQAARTCKQAVPDMPMIGSGYSYLQNFLPHIAQAVVRQGWIDSVGLGRMVLSYPELPADTLSGKPAQRKRICRTFSDCTTAPRNGMISGCFPLDPYYKSLIEAEQLRAVKQAQRNKN